MAHASSAEFVTEILLTFCQRGKPINPTSNNRRTGKQGESSVLINEKQVENRFPDIKKQGEGSILVDEELRFGMLQVASRVHAVEGA